MLGVYLILSFVILILAQCGVYVNMDINTTDIGKASVSSAADCCTQCSNFAGCLAGVFNQGQCYFKSQSTGMVSHTGATVMVPPPYPPPDPSCKSYTDNDYTGTTQIGIVDAPSFQVCCAECKKTSGCTAGVYYQQKCYLKSGKGQTVSSPGKVTVMVGSSPSPSPSPTDCPAFNPYKPQAEAPPLLTSTDGSCGCADAPCQGVTPRFNWIMTMCNSPSTRCPTAGDNGCACSSTNYKNKTKVNLNYIAGYQLTYNGASWVWQLEPSSSLNLVQGSGSVYTMNNSKQMVFDAANKVNDFANLPTENDVRKNPPPENKRVVNSVSGGGGDWDLAVFPYSTPGLSPPGMLYVFSGRLQAAAWFMLNQGTLDRGPNKATCPSTDNCWSKGSSGEIDFLEAPLLFGDYKTWDTNSDRKMWATTYNGAGRCFNQNVMQGSQCNPDGYCIANPLYQNGSESGGGDMFYTNYFAQGAGGPYSLFNYNWDDGKEHIWAAVVDFRGAFLYRDPSWPGITSTTAAAVLTSLTPDLSTPMTAGACGDPIVYPDPSIRSLPCVLYLASGPLLLSQEQWDKATQLVTDRPAGWTQRYIYSGADEVANFWNTGAVQCKSEVWWNLFIDTLQVSVPPTTYGVIYTKSMLQNNQPIIIPGYRKDVNSSWQGIVKDNAGNVQSVQEGRLDYSCLPGTHGSFVNCPYTGQITWAQAYLKYSPEGMNVDLCGGGAGCCKCSQDKYYSVLSTNACPKACSQSTFLDALQLPNHLGCAYTMPACPLSSQPAGCAPMGPYGYSAKGNQCAFPGICPVETCFTAVGSNNWPWPDSDARRP